MISMGIAVSTITGPAPYAVTRVIEASVAAMVPAGAEEAIPMTVSWASPSASGSSLAGGPGTAPGAKAGLSSVMKSFLLGLVRMASRSNLHQAPLGVPHHHAYANILDPPQWVGRRPSCRRGSRCERRSRELAIIFLSAVATCTQFADFFMLINFG